MVKGMWHSRHVCWRVHRIHVIVLGTPCLMTVAYPTVVQGTLLLPVCWRTILHADEPPAAWQMSCSVAPWQCKQGQQQALLLALLPC
jgi:hypothetical protein